MARYTAPEGWYAGRSGEYSPAISCSAKHLTFSSNAGKRFWNHLTVKFSGAEDVLSIQQVSAFTGYSTKTVYRWCSEKGMKPSRISKKVLIPKIILINYLFAEDANRCCKKSAAHLALIPEFLLRYKRIGQSGLRG